MYDIYDDFDFDENFDECEFSNDNGFEENSLEDECDCESDSEDSYHDASEKVPEDENNSFFDKFSGREAFYAGSLLGFCYNEGLIEAQKRRDERKIKKSDECSDDEA